ncbi:MAG: thiol:disulfide interchange protein DsbG [Chromatiales bacterium 21-64-14]|nr:MAG: thiol:disulfide interchange protein DsbG [Chromatiales bacterium 21-64-14]HQU15819.1 thiol:disulfide interchange protein DsbG [Gammaproteobacteria bacterium]
MSGSRTLVLLPAICLALTALLWGQSAPAASTLKQAQERVGQISHGHATVHQVFKGPAGLTGVVLEIQGRKTVAWLTADGQHLLLGNLFGPNGTNETRAAMEQVGLIPKPLPVPELTERSARADGFTVGKKGPLLTAYIDPNCIYCHKFYEQIMPLVKKGRIRVRFIPVAFLKPSSPGKAAALLHAKDPAAALATNEDSFDTTHEEGGLSPLAHPPAALLARIKSNTELLGKSGQLATPTLIYCNRKGTPVLLQGLPDGAIETMMKSIVDVRNGRCAAAAG